MEFKPYLFGPLSFGSRLMFRFRSGNIALNGPMATSNRDRDPSCPCCGAECESVVHCLVQCPAYDQCRSAFESQLRHVVGDDEFQHFVSKSDVDRAVCMLSHKWCPESVRLDACLLGQTVSVYCVALSHVSPCTTANPDGTPTPSYWLRPHWGC